MNLVFYNLHADGLFMKPVFYFLTKRPCFYKYRYLLDYLIKSKQKIHIVIDGKQSSIPSSFKILKKIITPKFEFFFWCKINHLKCNQFIVYDSINQLSNSDILFFFARDVIELNLNFNSCRALKLASLTHIHLNIEKGKKYWNNINNLIFLCECNIKHNAFFKKFYNWYKGEIYILPFVFQKRFCNKIDFSTRKPKAIATGSLVAFKDYEYVEFYHCEFLHTMRKILYDNKDINIDCIDSFISEFYEKPVGEQTIADVDSVIKKIKVKIYNFFYRHLLCYMIANQKKYMSFDMVDKYNEYKMAIVPEENTGILPIGFVECMACGCAYIGINSKIYEDLGLIPNIHYIAYDGSYGDLISKIRYYQKNDEELEKIANAGYNFVTENFNGHTVAEKFFGDLNDGLINGKLRV